MTPPDAGILGRTPTAPGPTTMPERRCEVRRPVPCDLWMIDHCGSTVLRSRCVDVSKNGMHLRVPLGYGVADGQRYELRSHLPGMNPKTSWGFIGARWATVVRTQVLLDEDEDYLDVGVVLDQTDAQLARLVS